MLVKRDSEQNWRVMPVDYIRNFYPATGYRYLLNVEEKWAAPSEVYTLSEVLEKFADATVYSAGKP